MAASSEHSAGARSPRAAQPTALLRELTVRGRIPVARARVSVRELRRAAIGCAPYGAEPPALYPDRALATLPFAIFGALEYRRRATVRGEGVEPAPGIARSPALLPCGAGWAAAALWSVHWS